MEHINGMVVVLACVTCLMEEPLEWGCGICDPFNPGKTLQHRMLEHLFAVIARQEEWYMIGAWAVGNLGNDRWIGNNNKEGKGKIFVTHWCCVNVLESLILQHHIEVHNISYIKGLEGVETPNRTGKLIRDRETGAYRNNVIQASAKPTWSPCRTSLSTTQRRHTRETRHREPRETHLHILSVWEYPIQ